MPRRLAIATFVDACGWGVVSPRGWFLDELAYRRRVDSVFGYSSACVPAILTGKLPNENDHWSSFFYSPSTSPFRNLRHLRLLPGAVFDRGRVRAWLSKGLARAHGFTGYFQVYNVPFDALPLFDYGEKRDIFRLGGINRGTSIFDDLDRERVPHHVSDWRRSEEESFRALEEAVQSGEPRFAFLYTAGLDALMHDRTKDAPEVDDKLRWYQRRLRRVAELARRRYDEVRVAVFSDHGMATVERVVDLVPRVEATELRFGADYAAIHDSTMMRFWFLRPHAEARVRDALPDGPDGRWVPDEELRRWGALFEDGRYGHAIYALEPGVLLNPSHMGRVALAGMHGYRPDHPDSDSALLASFEPETDVRCITDLYRLMREMARWGVADCRGSLQGEQCSGGGTGGSVGVASASSSRVPATSSMR